MRKTSAPRTAPRVPFLILALLGLASCVNEAYDIDNLNTEITVAQSGLALPVGNTKQLQVKDLIKDLDGDVLSLLDGGAYAIRMSEKMDLSENLPDLNDMLKINDISIDETFRFDIGAINSEDLTIDGQDITQEIDFGNYVDTGLEIQSQTERRSETIMLGVAEYARKIQDIDLSAALPDAEMNSTVSFRMPSVSGNYTPTFPFPEQTQTMDETATDLHIGFDSPDQEGNISRICDLKMSGTSRMTIKATITGHEFITSGDVCANLAVDFGGLFEFAGMDSAEIGIEWTFNSENDFTVTKDYAVSAINIDADNWNGSSFSQTNVLKTRGTLTIKDATTSTTAINNYNGEGLNVNISISFSDFAVESATMDINGISVTETVTVPVSLAGIDLPDYVSGIEEVIFSESSSIDMELGLENIDDPNLDVTVNSLGLKFPERLSVKNSETGEFSFENIDLRNGFGQTFYLASLNLPEPVDGEIKWDDEMTITAKATVSGKGVNSANFPATDAEDCAIKTNATVTFQIEDWTAKVNDFDVDFETINQDFTQELNGDVADYGTLTIHPEGTPAVSVTLDIPELALGIVPGSRNITVRFPEFIRFKNIDKSYNFDETTNTLVFTDEIPENIILDIDKIVVTPKKVEGSDSYRIEGAFSVEGNIGIKEGLVSGKDIEAIGASKIEIKASIPEITAASLDINEFGMDINEIFRATLLKADELPDDIKILGLSEALLDNTTAEFDIRITGLPDVGEDKDIDIELDIALPKELVLADDGRVNGNILTISGKVDKKDGSVDIAPITVSAIDLSEYDFGKGEDLVEEITVNGRFSVDEPNIDLSTLNGTVNARIIAGINGISFKKVTGRIDYKLDETSESVSLKDMPDMLKDEKFNLDFYNPYITLKATTNMGIPLTGDISVVPVRGGTADESEKIEFELNMDGSESSAETETVTYFIAAKQDGCPADYTFIETPNIKKLISRIPDEIKVSFNAGTDSSKDCVIEPSADYAFDVEYEFVCPLEFGEDLNLEISDTIRGLDGVIAKALKDNTIKIGGMITNSLPLQLELQVELLDDQDKAVPLKSPARQTISSCNSDGSANTSEMSLELVTVSSAAEASISSIRMTFIVTSGNVSGIAVTEDMFVQATGLKLLLPEGITIDINELN